MVPKHLWSGFRQKIANELHRRALLRLSSPVRITSISVHTEGYAENHDILGSLCDYLSIPRPADDHTTYHALFGRENNLGFKFESHREFATFQFIRGKKDGEGLFETKQTCEVPDMWFHSLKNVISCLSIEAVETASLGDIDGDPKPILEAFQENYVLGSTLSNGKGRVYSDFRIDGRGYHRILVLNGGANGSLNGLQLGRSVQRLVDVEAYSSMAKMGMFTGRTLCEKLDKIGGELIDINKQLEEKEKEKLDAFSFRLFEISNKVHTMNNENRFRFQASNSYFPIVIERLQDLKLDSTVSFEPYDVFILSRLMPAMRTTEAAELRMDNTLDQVNKTATLIQTAVELEVKDTNNKLLESMNRKTDVQIKLQKTVEGLSAVILTYYSVGLLGTMIRGVSGVGFLPETIHIDALSAISVAPIGLFYYVKVRQKLIESENVKE